MTTPSLKHFLRKILMFMIPGTPGFKEDLQGSVDLFIFSETYTKARRTLLGACSIILIIFHFQINIKSVNISGVGFSNFSSETVLKIAWIFSFYFFVRCLLYGLTDLRNWQMNVVIKGWAGGRIGQTLIAKLNRLGSFPARLKKKENDNERLTLLHEMQESILASQKEAENYLNKLKNLVFWERVRISVFELLLPLGVFIWATWVVFNFQLPEPVIPG